jgi:hypothetical protein
MLLVRTLDRVSGPTSVSVSLFPSGPLSVLVGSVLHGVGISRDHFLQMILGSKILIFLTFYALIALFYAPFMVSYSSFVAFLCF